MKQFIINLLSLLWATVLGAQTLGTVSGTVKDKYTQEPLISVALIFTGSQTHYTVSDENGYFTIDLPVGTYQLEASYISYAPYFGYQIIVNSGQAQVLSIELEEQSQELEGVVIRSGTSARATDMITPLATQKLTAEEIKLNPGGNFDISKVIQVLPGVAGGTSPNRNDLIVRGGGPSENVYYLDGIEIPVLNHFQTQGASGGATGILNVSFIQDVQLTSSAFNSMYGNALASTMVIKQRRGNSDKISGNFRLSGSEIAAMLEGPIGTNTTFMASGRRSYLQFLFQILDLPIRPDYYDFQFKVHYIIDSKTELTVLGLGAIDHFRMAVPKNSDATQEYILRANPLINQWNYTTGASLKRLVNQGYYTLALSRNMFFNGADRYENNAAKEGPLLFSLASHEIENKLRWDMSKFVNGWRYSYGADLQYVKYNASIFNILQREVRDSLGNILRPEISWDSQSEIDFYRLGAYGQVGRYFWNEKLLLSAGIRADMNSFTTSGWDASKTLSPRFSASYTINERWNISASVGNYYKLPVYTMLGYVDSEGNLTNKDLKYIQSIHYTLGTQFIPRRDLRFTLETFYKDYRNYPVSLESGISYANIGTDFSAVGNEPFSSIGRGRVYGVEAYVQQKLVKNLFYLASATYYKSEYSGSDNQYRPSTWDYNFIFSTTLGYQFKKNWDIGIKYRFAGGQPYTPFDIEASTASYLTTGSGVYDYSQLNQKRLPVFTQLDLRVDKKFNFQKSTLGLFVDFQNILLYKTPSIPRFTFERTADNSGFKTTDGLPIQPDGSNAIPVILEQNSATVVPSIGFIFEF